ncbi:MAG: N-acetylglucosamine-6-phosphate deacetylase [Succinivibrio sp.]|jgi:N-acetylglucosamine-6-phosphate deacetylase|nr:N-acetylglucosamine-6-phosphate deacetylase [Succinivibrio sp.]
MAASGRLENLKIYDPQAKGGFRDGALRWERGRFAKTSASASESRGEALYAIPTLCDIHLHGAAGADLMDATPEALEKICRYEASQGVGIITPASMTMGRDDILKALRCAKDYAAQQDIRAPEARIAGIYMEGPYVSPQKCGAQDPGHIIAPSPEGFEEAFAASGGLIRTVALAPEIKGAFEFLGYMSERRPLVRVSLAHTGCDYETALKAFKAGACELTHMFNAMPPMLHRAPGPIPAALFAGADAELIADGVHVAAPMLALACRLFAPERLILISDSMRATGLVDGEYTLGGQKVLVRGREARLLDGTLAGSVTSLYGCAQNLVSQGILNLEDAVRCAAVSPRRALRLKTPLLGCEGEDASFALCDAQMRRRAVVLHGELISGDLR